MRSSKSADRCINSVALRFIPADALEQNGYGEFVPALPDRRKNNAGLTIDWIALIRNIAHRTASTR